MKYMFLTYLDEKAWAALGEAEQQRMMAECTPHVERLIASGKFLGGAPLHPTSTATTVRLRDGKRLVTDGPFAETREQIGGYTLIDANDLDEAISIAAGFLGTRSPSIIEIRPVAELKGLPTH
ncbi:MAG TPA: YciI family protein [Bryobacteraceae bacterium]|nr:YciI family protein [Bryobacteraceae bacterium]